MIEWSLENISVTDNSDNSKSQSTALSVLFIITFFPFHQACLDKFLKLIHKKYQISIYLYGTEWFGHSVRSL